VTVAGESGVLGTSCLDVTGAARRVGTDHDRAFDEGGAVTWAVTDRDLWWQLGKSVVEHHDVVAHGVGPCVARTKQPRECLTGAVCKTQGWIEPEAPLVVGAGSFLVLRVDLDERGVDVQVDRAVPLCCGGSTPHIEAHLGERAYRVRRPRE
jgi:hypothetical protein